MACLRSPARQTLTRLGPNGNVHHARTALSQIVGRHRVHHALLELTVTQPSAAHFVCWVTSRQMDQYLVTRALQDLRALPRHRPSSALLASYLQALRHHVRPAPRDSRANILISQKHRSHALLAHTLLGRNHTVLNVLQDTIAIRQIPICRSRVQRATTHQMDRPAVTLALQARSAIGVTQTRSLVLLGRSSLGMLAVGCVSSVRMALSPWMQAL